jgi:prevent-host-death family protein
MERQVNIHEAKTTLSKLVEDVEHGATVILARSGRPVARIVPLEKKRPICFGQMKGKIKMGSDFDAPLPFSFQVDL